MFHQECRWKSRAEAKSAVGRRSYIRGSNPGLAFAKARRVVGVIAEVLDVIRCVRPALEPQVEMELGGNGKEDGQDRIILEQVGAGIGIALADIVPGRTVPVQIDPEPAVRVD